MGKKQTFTDIETEGHLACEVAPDDRVGVPLHPCAACGAPGFRALAFRFTSDTGRVAVKSQGATAKEYVTVRAFCERHAADVMQDPTAMVWEIVRAHQLAPLAPEKE